MAIRTLVLAASPREGGHYAKRAGLKRWTYRVIHSAGQIKGLPYSGIEVHILPSFERMKNSSSILAVLRYRRGVEYLYVDPDDLPTLEELEGEKQSAELGDLTDEDLEAAYATNSVFDHASWDAVKRRRQIQDMSDEDLSELLRKPEPTEFEKALQDEVVKTAVKPRAPRKPAKPAADAASFFGAED